MLTFHVISLAQSREAAVKMTQWPSLSETLSQALPIITNCRKCP
jgi:hypothetical protein